MISVSNSYKSIICPVSFLVFYQEFIGECQANVKIIFNGFKKKFNYLTLHLLLYANTNQIFYVVTFDFTFDLNPILSRAFLLSFSFSIKNIN